MRDEARGPRDPDGPDEADGPIEELEQLLRFRAAVVSRIAHESCEQAPSTMPRGPWWRGLESNFYKRPEGFELALRDQLRVGGTAALDVLIRTAGALMVGTTAVPLGYHPRALDRAMRDRHFYERLAERGDREAFFRPPPSGIDVRVRKARFPSYRPPNGVVEDLSFDSPFEPVNPLARRSYGRHAANRVAHARLWRHRHGPRPTIVAIHGFGADTYLVNQIMFALPYFYDRLGCDVMLFTLPFHGPRQTRWSLFSGHGFFAGGIARINEAFAQAVHDFRAFVDFLEGERGVEAVGATGISLGGHTTALLAATEPRLKFAIPNVPVASIADLVMEWEPVGALLRTGLFLLGKRLRDARGMLAVSCPLTWKPLLPRDRLMVIGGVGDRLAPPKHTRLLWDHWGRCRLHWFPGSHIVHLDKGSYVKEMARFMREIGFVERR